MGKKAIPLIEPEGLLILIYLFRVLHHFQHCRSCHNKYFYGQRKPAHAVGQGSVL